MKKSYISPDVSKRPTAKHVEEIQTSLYQSASEKELIEHHNEGEISLLLTNNKTKDRFLRAFDAGGGIFRNEDASIIYVCEPANDDVYDFDVFNNAIKLKKGQKLKDFLDSTTTYNVVEEFKREEYIDHLIQKCKENFDSLCLLTGAEQFKALRTLTNRYETK